MFETVVVKGEAEYHKVHGHQNITVTQRGGMIAKLQKRWSFSNNLRGPLPCSKRQQEPGCNSLEAVSKNYNKSIRTWS